MRWVHETTKAYSGEIHRMRVSIPGALLGIGCGLGELLRST